MIGYKTTQVLKALGWFCVAAVLCAVLLTGVLNPVLNWLVGLVENAVPGALERFTGSISDTETG